MMAPTSDLAQAFRDDHAVLGRGLHEVSAYLRGGDLRAAKDRADRLDREAGPHIAFEERCFYPVLRRLLGDAEVERLYGEHGDGLAAIRSVAALPEGAVLDESERRGLLEQLEAMETHVVECGELFGAMGRIPRQEQEALHRELLALRERAPRWTELTAGRESGGAAFRSR